MIEIEEILVSDEVLDRKFKCNLSDCKGNCCEEGDAGAPLEKDELELITKNFKKIKKYLTPNALTAIQSNGKYELHPEFGWVTTTIPNENEICVYAKRNPIGIIQCVFELAYSKKIINWKKPLSCHLFPLIAEEDVKKNYRKLNFQPRLSLCERERIRLFFIFYKYSISIHV